MEIEKLVEAIKLCGSTPSVYQCKQCAYWAGGDMSQCIPRMAADVADTLERLQAENDRLKAQVPRWIPVEERLPEEEGAYIVCVDGEVKWDAYCRFGRKERWLCYDGRLNALYIDPYSSKPKREPPYPRVTHWLALPKAPKEEKKDD